MGGQGLTSSSGAAGVGGQSASSQSGPPSPPIRGACTAPPASRSPEPPSAAPRPSRAARPPRSAEQAVHSWLGPPPREPASGELDARPGGAGAWWPPGSHLLSPSCPLPSWFPFLGLHSFSLTQTMSFPFWTLFLAFPSWVPLHPRRSDPFPALSLPVDS